MDVNVVKNPKLLIIDDEAPIRRAMQRIFEAEYSVFTAEDGPTGLKILETEKDVGVIICDYQMPGLNGIETLRLTTAISPFSVKILTSAYVEIQSFTHELDECAIYTFISKPFDIDALLIVIRRAMEHYQLTIRNQALLSKLKQQVRKEQTLRKAFQQYVPKEVVDELLISENENSLELEGKCRDVTILFADLRQFTSFAELRPPAEVVKILNLYFQVMSTPILANFGTIDKYIGDAILAHFGAVREDEFAPLNAVRAALEMRNQLEAFNRELNENGIDPFQFGIGINSGDAIVGNIGCSARVDYTVIGDVVNLAQRIEEISKLSSGSILISGSTFERVREFFVVKPWYSYQVRGRKGTVEIYEVIS